MSLPFKFPFFRSFQDVNMPPLLCNRILDSPFPPRFFASFSLATTYFEPNLVGVSNSGSLWHYSIHPLLSFCQPFSVNSLKTSTIIHPSASHNFQYVCNHLLLLLIPGIIFCNLHIGIPPHICGSAILRVLFLCYNTSWCQKKDGTP